MEKEVELDEDQGTGGGGGASAARNSAITQRLDFKSRDLSNEQYTLCWAQKKKNANQKPVEI